MGEVARLQHDFQKAIKYYKTALQIYEDAQDSYNASDEYQGLGQLEKEQGNFESAEAYFKKALNIRLEKQDWHKVAATLVEWGETLEAKQDWINALKIYIQALGIDVQHNREFVREDIRALGRMIKMLEKLQFQAVWRYVTGKECPEDWLSAIRAASEEQEE
jgi:tetratricopeptide (TPR) repeat protein